MPALEKLLFGIEFGSGGAAAGAATLAHVKAALTSDARRSALMSTDALGGN